VVAHAVPVGVVVAGHVAQGLGLRSREAAFGHYLAQSFDDLADPTVEDALGSLVDEGDSFAASFGIQGVADFPQLVHHVQEITHIL